MKEDLELLSWYPPGREWRMTNGERWTKLENDPAFKQRFEAATVEHKAKLDADPVYRTKHISFWATHDIAARIKIEALLYQAAGKGSVEIPRKLWTDASFPPAKLEAILNKYGYGMPTLRSAGNVFAKKLS